MLLTAGSKRTECLLYPLFLPVFSPLPCEESGIPDSRHIAICYLQLVQNGQNVCCIPCFSLCFHPSPVRNPEFRTPVTLPYATYSWFKTDRMSVVSPVSPCVF